MAAGRRIQITPCSVRAATASNQPLRRRTAKCCAEFYEFASLRTDSGETGRGKVRDEMVLNLDLAQTFLDFAGLAAPKEMQGSSWRPLLGRRAVPWRQSWFYEYFAERQNNSRVPDVTAVRMADAKLIR